MHSNIGRTSTNAAIAVAALSLLLQSAPALADDGYAPDGGDPGVARISVAQGGVQVQRSDSGDTFDAVVNAPLSVGDYVTTDDDSYAEIEFDHGSVLRLAPDTQMRFTQLQFDNHQVQLAQGTVDLRLFRGLGAHPTVQTPAATIVPDGDGSFRITVTGDGNSDVTARYGRVDVQTAAGTQTLQPGSTLAIVGDPNAPQFQTLDPVAFDAFDAFDRRRDAYVERSHDWAYVDAGFVGADDLDQYGQWTDMPGYGQVWQPTDEPDGWAPYNTGRWVWQPYYGWAWVDDAPWGYAPYHYGRWFYASGWYWAPGINVAGPVAYSAPVVYAPQPVFYRPALVAFFSFGGGGGIGLGFGNIGWCPLAPSEPYHPWYGGVTNVTNVTNVNVNVTNVNVTNVNVTNYRNLRAPGGAVAVNNGNFASGNFRTIQRVSPAELTHVSAVRGVVPVVPTRSNLAFNGRAVAPVAAPHPLAERFTRFATQPKAVTPTFATQQRVVQSAAVRTYPEHAAIFQHPEVQKTLARPGLYTNADAPELLKPNAKPAGAELEKPASAAPEEKPVAPERAPVEPLRTQAPETLRTAAPEPAERATVRPDAPPVSPFDRFNRAPSQDGATPRPYRTAAPYRTASPYRSTDQAPVVRAHPARTHPPSPHPAPVKSETP